MILLDGKFNNFQLKFSINALRSFGKKIPAKRQNEKTRNRIRILPKQALTLFGQASRQIAEKQQSNRHDGKNREHIKSVEGKLNINKKSKVESPPISKIKKILQI